MKVEELLASIRKSVDDDMDGLGTSMNTQSRGTLMRGALREMRVNLSGGETSQAFNDDISTLRDRIRAKVEAQEITLDIPLAAPPAPAARLVAPKPVASPNSLASTAQRNDFSSILSAPHKPMTPANHMRAQIERAQHLPLRPSHVDDSQSEIHYRPENQAGSDWGDEYAGAHQGYEENQHGADYGADYGADEANHYPMVHAPLMSAQAEAAAETAFRQLSDTLLSRATGERSIEDMTKDLLRGMIKQWLDANLPALVEDLVREEIERVARRGR